MRWNSGLTGQKIINAQWKRLGTSLCIEGHGVSRLRYYLRTVLYTVDSRYYDTNGILKGIDITGLLQ